MPTLQLLAERELVRERRIELFDALRPQPPSPSPSAGISPITTTTLCADFLPQRQPDLTRGGRVTGAAPVGGAPAGIRAMSEARSSTWITLEAM
jgi:hypothetical protein